MDTAEAEVGEDYVVLPETDGEPVRVVRIVGTTIEEYMMSDCLYEYVAINPGEIRVVMLYPTHNGHVMIKFLTGRLRDFEGQFEALSYTWGTSVKSRRIRLADKPWNSILVTPNLYDALMTLGSGNDKRLRLLWIDQISINQDDVQEKNVQVAQMTDVYSAASNVMVWLSADIWQDESLMKQFIGFSGLVNNILECEEGGEVDKEDPLESAQEIFQAVVKVYGSTAYFRRVWIIQELLCARKAWVMIGGSCATFESIIEHAVLLQTTIQSDPRFRILRQACSFPADFRKTSRALQKLATMWTRFYPQRAQELYAMENFNKAYIAKWTLLDLFRKSLTFEATEPKDHVYAMAGLLRFTDYCVPQQVSPDYSQQFSYKALALQMFVYGYTMQGSLENLVYSTSRVFPEYPSWMGGFPGRFILDYPWIIGQDLKASGDMSSKILYIKADVPLLSCRLTRIATIEELELVFPADEKSTPSYFDSTAYSLDDMFEYLARCWKLVADPVDRDLSGPAWESFCNTFPLASTNQGNSGNLAAESFSELSHNPDVANYDLSCSLGALLMQAAYHKDHRAFVVFHEKLSDDCGVSLFGCSDMRFAVGSDTAHPPGHTTEVENKVSQRGRRICWVPPDTQIGDKVCIIHGLRLPMVVRQLSDGQNRHMFLGPCYVDGCMKGEMAGLLASSFEELLIA